MAEYNVHRLRIGDWVPSTIKCIASDLYSTKVAIGREDGDIEISDSGNKWYCQARIPGQTDFKLQSLVWSTHESDRGRLFGTSLRGFLFEVDLTTLKLKNIRDSYGGAIWSIATSPRSAVLATGCEDGTIRLYSYDNLSLEYRKTLPAMGNRITSLAYHPVKQQLLAGSGDGFVRGLHEDTGRVIVHITVDVMKGSASAVIWSILVLSDSTIVTGDSNGRIQIWDGLTGVLTNTFRQHTADVLALVASYDSNSIFASGVDGKVVCIQRIVSEVDSSLSSWVYVHSHRAHSHDVHSLSLCYTPNMDSANKSRPLPLSHSDIDVASTTAHGHWIVLSGGSDAKLCTYSATNFTKVRPSWIPAVSANSLVNCNDKFDTVAIKHRTYVDLWYMALSTDTTESSTPCQLSLRLKVKGTEHIHCMGVSPNGKYLAVANTAGLRLWQLNSSGKDEAQVSKKKNSGKTNDSQDVAASATTITPALVTLPPALSNEFCHAVQFNKQGTLMAVFGAVSSTVMVFNIKASATDHTVSVSLNCTFDHSRNLFDEMDVSALSLAVSRMQFNHNGNLLAVSSCANEVIVYDMTSRDVYWRLPTFSSSITNIQFMNKVSSKNAADTLLVLLANNTFQLFNVTDRCFAQGSSSNTAAHVPKYVRQMPGAIAGVALDAHDHNKFVLYGQGYCVFVNLAEKVPTHPRSLTQTTSALLQKNFNRKRKHNNDDDEQQQQQLEEVVAAQQQDSLKNSSKKNDKKKVAAASTSSSTQQDESSNFMVVNIYRNLIHVGAFGKDQLVVVENSWLRTVDSLSDVVERKRYGV